MPEGSKPDMPEDKILTDANPKDTEVKTPSKNIENTPGHAWNQKVNEIQANKINIPGRLNKDVTVI